MLAQQLLPLGSQSEHPQHNLQGKVRRLQPSLQLHRLVILLHHPIQKKAIEVQSVLGIPICLKVEILLSHPVPSISILHQLQAQKPCRILQLTQIQLHPRYSIS